MKLIEATTTGDSNPYLVGRKIKKTLNIMNFYSLKENHIYTKN
jgi:hypothetical protein